MVVRFHGKVCIRIRFSFCMLLASLMVAGLSAPAHSKTSVLSTPHNLSAGGGGGKLNIKFSEEMRVCVFCHVPHNAGGEGPLWSRGLATQATPYKSSSLNASPKPDRPTGASRLCLSCHDGTIATGNFQGSRITGAPRYLTGESSLTTDLSDDHPISFNYTELLAIKSNLVSPHLLPLDFRLEGGLVLQCTSCHDPHDNQYGNFLVVSNTDPLGKTASPLCVACHKQPGWDLSTHNLKNTAAMPKGCMTCHTVHNAPGAERLLKSAKEEDVCFLSCHSAIKQLITPSLFGHPVDRTSGIHEENEMLPAQKYHVECADCHNPHQVSAANAPLASPPQVNGRLKGVIKDSTGKVAVAEYEICFKCHSGDNAALFRNVTDLQPRLIADPDVMNMFDQLNPSFHPVMSVTRLPTQGASLLAAYKQTMTMIYCTDCHNNDQSVKAGGIGPNGPHGSQYSHILIARYDMPVAGTAGSTYDTTTYGLCFRCHSETYVMNAAGFGTAFALNGTNEHSAHVRDRKIPCSACHDPHGISWKRGATAANNAHLINFNTGYAAGPAVTNPVYVTSAPGSGSCTVNCHTLAGNTHDYGASVLPRRLLRRK